MNQKKLYKLGTKLGLSETEIKAAIQKNRNKIITGVIVVLALIFVGNNGFQPLHYIAVSIKDFDFFMRLF